MTLFRVFWTMHTRHGHIKWDPVSVEDFLSHINGLQCHTPVGKKLVDGAYHGRKILEENTFALKLCQEQDW